MNLRLMPCLRHIASAACLVFSLLTTANATVHVPSGWVLEPTDNQGKKQFHLVAEDVRADIGDGKEITVWGYNGSSAGPVLVVPEGETFSVLITNQQRAWTSFSIHGLQTSATATGLPDGSTKAIKNGETWEYTFHAARPGIYRYGPHFEHRQQEQRGLVGAVLVLPAAQLNQQHIVLTIHELGGRNAAARTLLNGRVAPKVDDVPLLATQPVALHVLNLSPRSQSLQIPGMAVTRSGVGGDTSTAPRQGARFSFTPRSGDWWLFFADINSKPLSSEHAMPGMPGMPVAAESLAFPRISGLATKLRVAGQPGGQLGTSRLLSSDANYRQPQRKPR